MRRALRTGYANGVGGSRPHRCRNGGTGLARSGAGSHPLSPAHGLGAKRSTLIASDDVGLATVPASPATRRGVRSLRAPHPQAAREAHPWFAAASQLARSGTRDVDGTL